MEQIFREVKTKISLYQTNNPDFPSHIHDDIELCYIKKGSGTVRCDGKKYEVSDGSWFLAFPNQVHSYEGFARDQYYVLILKPSALLRFGEYFTQGLPESAVYCFPNGVDDGLGQLLETACREHRRDGFSDVIAAYLTALFGKLLPHFPIEKSGLPQNTVQRILQYCGDHYREDITLPSVAEQLGLSRSSISHIFNSRIGMHFCQYINTLRLAEAEALLRNPNISVTEAASRAGFATIRTFNRAFLKKHGVSPSAYRKM